MVQKFREGREEKAISLKVMEVEIPRFNKSYSSVRRGELLFLAGSLGFIEVAAKEDSASQRLKAKPGDPVKIVFRQ